MKKWIIITAAIAIAVAIGFYVVKARQRTKLIKQVADAYGIAIVDLFDKSTSDLRAMLKAWEDQQGKESN